MFGNKKEKRFSVKHREAFEDYIACKSSPVPRYWRDRATSSKEITNCLVERYLI